MKKSESQHYAQRAIARVVVAYATFASLWILLSDKTLAWLFAAPTELAVAGMLKGWLFVAVTSLLLYGLMRRQLGAGAQAETERLNTLKLLAAIADNSEDAIFAKDVEGRYTLFNRAAGRLIGIEPEAVLGRDDSAVFPAAVAQVVRAKDRGIMATNLPRRYEESLPGRTGMLTVEVTKGPLRDEDGNVVGLFGIARDISQRKAAEEQTLRRNAELERFNRAMMGRELEMIRLKRQINELSRQAGREPPFDLSFADLPETPEKP